MRSIGAADTGTARVLEARLVVSPTIVGLGEWCVVQPPQM